MWSKNYTKRMFEKGSKDFFYYFVTLLLDIDKTLFNRRKT